MVKLLLYNIAFIVWLGLPFPAISPRPLWGAEPGNQLAQSTKNCWRNLTI